MEAEEHNEPALESGPGRRLLEARRAANLSVVDVSTQLHLDKATVEALEQDDYARLPAPAFVRGYLRSYARLLNLAPGPVVNAYDSRGFEPPALVADISTSTHAQGESTDLPWRLMTYLVAAVVITLVVLWWRNNMNDPFSVLDGMVGVEAPPPATTAVPDGPADTSLAFQPRTDPESAPGSGPDDGVIAESLPVPGTTGEASPPIPGEPPPLAAGTPAPAAPAAAGGSETAAEASAAAPQPAATATLPASPDAANEELASTTSGEQPSSEPAVAEPGVDAAAGPASNPQATTATGRLDLAFTHDSWVEVYDAAGERLFFGMARAGRELALEGTLPMQVLLGYAREIRVEYNGRLLDYSPYVSRGIARFTLGEDGIRSDSEAAGSATSAQ